MKGAQGLRQQVLVLAVVARGEMKRRAAFHCGLPGQRSGLVCREMIARRGMGRIALQERCLDEQLICVLRQGDDAPRVRPII